MLLHIYMKSYVCVCACVRACVCVCKLSSKQDTHTGHAQTGGGGGAFRCNTEWNVIIALTLWPIACFFFGLVRLGRSADGLHIQLLPWMETRSRIHNQNPWQDAPPRLRKGKRKKRKKKKNEIECCLCLLNVATSNPGASSHSSHQHLINLMWAEPPLVFTRADSGVMAPVPP